MCYKMTNIIIVIPKIVIASFYVVKQNEF